MENSTRGTLYVCATPIGNYNDISQRCIDILKLVDNVICEDTRVTGLLLHHLGFKKPLLSAHKFNEQQKVSYLITLLNDGHNLALLSDAGTPAVADPGARIVKQVRLSGIRIVPIPGPSAITTALSQAGLLETPFYFAGYLPAKPGERRKTITGWLIRHENIIFYEAPHRIIRALNDIRELLKDPIIILQKELTKNYETYYEDNCSSLLSVLQDKKVSIKGEWVGIVPISA